MLGALPDIKDCFLFLWTSCCAIYCYLFVLQEMLKKEKYLYILDCACVQFEPDDPEYVRVWCISVIICVCIYIYICVSVYIYMCVSVYASSISIIDF